MKKTVKALATLLAMAMLIGTTAVTAFTAESPAEASVFDGYQLTISDDTTPAVNMRGRTNDPNWMCFVAADDREIGVIPYGEYNAIIEKNKKMIYFPNGSSLAAPPDGRESWNEWFADEFNKLRGLGTGSREEAVATEAADTIKEYREEVIRLVNAEREKAGLPALAVNEKAMDYAQVRAKEISTNYSHTRPDGLEPPYDEIGPMGENITGGRTPDMVMKSWMESPGHRSNILYDDAVSIGVGCYWTGQGYFWVQEFVC